MMLSAADLAWLSEHTEAGLFAGVRVLELREWSAAPVLVIAVTVRLRARLDEPQLPGRAGYGFNAAAGAALSAVPWSCGLPAVAVGVATLLPAIEVWRYRRATRLARAAVAQAEVAARARIGAWCREFWDALEPLVVAGDSYRGACS